MNSYLLEVVLCAGSAILAFFIAQGTRQASTRTAALAAILTSATVLIVDRAVWASTEKGLIDHATCALVPASVACRSESMADGSVEPVAQPDPPAPERPRRLKSRDPLVNIEGYWDSYDLKGALDDAASGKLEVSGGASLPPICSQRTVTRVSVENGNLHFATIDPSVRFGEAATWAEEGPVSVVAINGNKLRVQMSEPYEFEVNEDQIVVRWNLGAPVATRKFAVWVRCELWSGAQQK